MSHRPPPPLPPPPPPPFFTPGEPDLVPYRSTPAFGHVARDFPFNPPSSTLPTSVSSLGQRSAHSFGTLLHRHEDSPAIDPRRLELGGAGVAGRAADVRVPLAPLSGSLAVSDDYAPTSADTEHSRPLADDEPVPKTRRLERSDAPTARQPPTKSVVRTYLNEQGHALITGEVRKWVGAEVEGLSDSLHRAASEQVASVLKDYSTSVHGFRSRVLAARRDLADCENLVAADDGYVYLRINEVELSAYLGSIQVLDKKVQSLQTALVESNGRVKALEETVESLAKGGRVGALAVAEIADATAGAADKGRMHHWTKVQTEFRNMVAKMAGLAQGRGLADDGDKIYDLPFPSGPGEWTLHPVTYEPTAADVPVPASELPAGSPKRYRHLRLDFGAAWDAEPNRAFLLPILKVMASNPVKYDIAAKYLPITPLELWDMALKRTWANWKKEAKERANKTPAQIKEEKEAPRRQQRRYHRQKGKLLRRRANAEAELSMTRDGQAHDIGTATILEDAMHSDEYSDMETLPGASAPSKVRVRRVPAYRSDEAGDVIHSFEGSGTVPTVTLIDRGETFDLPPSGRLPPGLPRWALKAEWAEKNPERLPLLVANRGPWTGPRSVASGPEAFGSGTYDRSTCNQARRGQDVVVIAHAAGSVVVLPSVVGPGPSRLSIAHIS